MIKSETPSATKRQVVKTALEVFLVVAAIAATKYAFLSSHLDKHDFQSFINRAGALAVPGFILLTAVGQMVLAPPPLFIGAGALMFGITLGTVYSVLGISLGGGIAFLLGRTVLKDFAGRRKTGWLRKIDECAETNGLALTVGLKLAFFANPPLNYVAGLTSVRLRDYLGGSVLGLGPGVFFMADVFEQWMNSASLLGLLVHPALLWMVLLRVVGVVMLVALARWHGKAKLPTYEQVISE